MADFNAVVALSNWSNITIYAAMAVYAVSFVFFSMDLAGRSARAGERAERRASAAGATRRAAEARGARGSGTAVLEAEDDGVLVERAVSEDAAAWRDTRATGALRIAMGLLYLGFALHVTATVLRGIAAARVPWANMFEFSLTFTALIVLVFIVARWWTDLRFLGTFITGFTTLWLGITTLAFYAEVVPLMPALQSVWLVIHVFIASLATGCLALGFGLSTMQLLQAARQSDARAGRPSKLRFLASLPEPERLENLAYRINVIGFILWTFTLVAGAIWAERAWGRYWGWDTKEVWTFIIWVVYAGYIHARATNGWRGTPSAWLSIIGFATVLFNFGIVNVFFEGLHSYSGL